MCDTIVALGSSTAHAAVLFGKNSDRQRNEAQAVEYLPGQCHDADSSVRCTYLTIPQVERTTAVLICRPFWTWGAEMGANEHGVVIGNEGLHARSPAPQESALTGMDLVRLGLERAASARQAVAVITSLLEQHGQGGNCGHTTPTYYHNGFLIADAREAWVLETVGREWLLQGVHGVRSMSNRYSIVRDVERCSSGLLSLLRSCGWSTQPEPDYAEVIADRSREHIGNASDRRSRSTALLAARAGSLDVSDMMRILRDHGGTQEWHPQCLVRRTLCMHAGGEERGGQTVGTMVSELRGARAVHWVTGTAAPCISIFKPLFMGMPTPIQDQPLTDRFDHRALWWRHERLHRAALQDNFAAFLEDMRAERDDIESVFRARINSVLRGGTALDRAHVVNECWNAAARIEDCWYARLGRHASLLEPPHADVWNKFSRLAGMDER
jgi:dipeptidase